jgi:circadian clock protein KaiC
METIMNNCVSTGNQQIDQILRGGFPINSINIIMGQPGSGKTIFAEQLVFHNAKNGDRPILYLTTLSEPVSKVLTYLERFSFYDETKINESIFYRDIGFDLVTGGLTAFKEQIDQSILELSPKIIVVDSFKALRDLTTTPSESRRMLYELAGTLSAFETTVFLVGEYSEEDVHSLPEFAVADGIIQFLRKSASTRDERFIRILKLRGSGYAEGLHGCSISENGIDVFPRLVSPPSLTSYTWKKERVSTGLESLDKLIGGGLWRGSSTLLAGPTGSGKTTFGLLFALDGVKKGEKSLYVNFQENPTQLSRLIESLGSDPVEVQKHGLELLYTSPVELQIDSIIVAILRSMEKNKVDRVVIDAVGDLSMAASNITRLQEYLYALCQSLATRDITIMLVFETIGNGLDGGMPTESIRYSNMADNLILLSSVTAPDYSRAIRILKARGSEHDLAARRFDITGSGIAIHETT